MVPLRISQQQASHLPHTPSAEHHHWGRPGRAYSVKAASSAAQLQPVAQDMSTSLTLENIRAQLIRQEDTIIFNLIERAQFLRNDPVYSSGAIPVPGFGRDGRRYSLLEYVLRETEQLHGSIRRYTSPSEHPFYPDSLPALVLPPIEYPPILSPSGLDINVNPNIMEVYINSILPEISGPGDDFNYGSAACLDVLVLQALSQRIHYGKFVAEAKFRAHPDQYAALIRSRDSAGIMALLTDVNVERMVLQRVHLKAATFGRDITSSDTGSGLGDTGADGGAVRCKVRPEVVTRVYDEFVMPLTKEVEVQYLLQRLDGGGKAQ